MTQIYLFIHLRNNMCQNLNCKGATRLKEWDTGKNDGEEVFSNLTATKVFEKLR